MSEWTKGPCNNFMTGCMCEGCGHPYRSHTKHQELTFTPVPPPDPAVAELIAVAWLIEEFIEPGKLGDDWLRVSIETCTSQGILQRFRAALERVEKERKA